MISTDIPRFVSRRTENRVSVEADQMRAQGVREAAWKDAEQLNESGLAGDAYRLMVEACARAWRIERGLESSYR